MHTYLHDDYEALYRRYLQLQKQVDHLSTLREIGLAISGTLELNDTLQTIANVLQGALDVRRLMIYELKEDQFIPVIAKFGNDLITHDRLEEEVEPRRKSPLANAFDTRSVVIANAAQGSRAYVPLVAKDEALGVLVLEDPPGGQIFTSDDALLFQQIGSQIAVAIHNAKLYAMAVTDGLTGLYVRRYFDLRLEEEFEQATRYKRAFSLMLFDIDHFKKFNDTHGHQTGDMVLKQFAALLRKNTRRSDIVCRYGGEEMAVILPETALEEAAILATKLCATVRKHSFTGTGGQELSVTTSIGVTEHSDRYANPADMVQAVDEALYEAKNLGRNRVELAEI
jgi:diguanylate cyclase (GGDEF)-like protein